MRAKGFTLIELLVVISVIIFLSAILLPNFRSADRQAGFRRSAAKLVQDLRGAEESSMSVKSSKQCSQGVEGYALNFNSGDNYYSFRVKCKGEGGFKQIDDFYFEKGVKIKDITVDGSSLVSTYVYFSPPDPSVFIFKSGGSGTVATIALSLINNSSQTKNIQINKAGLIYAE